MKVISPPHRYMYSKGNWFIFYDPTNIKWVKVNKAGKEIILAVEKNPDLHQTLRFLNKKSKISHEKIYDFIEYLVNDANYLHRDTYKKMDLKINRNTYPNSLYLHPTFSCNLSCLYCYNKREREIVQELNSFPELTLSDYKNLFHEAKEIGIKTLIYSGGEPLLRKDLFSIAAISKKLGFYHSIITNGTLIDEEKVKPLVEIFDHVSVSIDSKDETENDLKRGKGSWERALEGIKLLKSRGGNVSCLGVAHEGNIDSLEETWRFLVNEIGCSSFLPQAMIMDNTPSDKKQRVNGFVNKYYKIRNRLNKLNGTYGGIILRNSCGMCSGELAIGADGKVYPCQSLLKEEFCGGNFKQTSLKHILDHSQIFKEVRNLTVEDYQFCSDCNFKYLCGGGCRAIHYGMLADITKTDVQFCPMNKEIIVENMFESALHSPQCNRNPDYIGKNDDD
jgi:radical SAM protein with 4Fe4S-binding SPASM domain